VAELLLWKSTIEKFTVEKNQQLHSCQQIIKINSNDILFSNIILLY